MTQRKSPTKERLRLRALGGAIAKYEAVHGKITAGELATQARSDRRAARLVGRSSNEFVYCRFFS